MMAGKDESRKLKGAAKRRNSVSDDNKLARAVLLGCRHIKMSRNRITGSNGHAAVVVCPAIRHVPGSIILNAHQWKVGCGLLIVSVSSPLRHAIEKIPRDDVQPAGRNVGRGRLDPWRSSRIVSPRRVVN